MAFDFLRNIIVNHRQQMGELPCPCLCVPSDPLLPQPLYSALLIDELQETVQQGEMDAERLRELQAKFGVTRSVPLLGSVLKKIFSPLFVRLFAALTLVLIAERECGTLKQRW